MKIRRILFLAICVMIFSLLGNTKVSADEIVMNQDLLSKTSFFITVSPEKAKANPNFEDVTPEECEGKDEVMVRMDLTESTFLFLNIFCEGSMSYDIQDEQGNAIYSKRIEGTKNLGYLVNAAFAGVLPKGKYYWHFYDYSGFCNSGNLYGYIEVGGCDPCYEDDFPSRNDTMEDAILLSLELNRKDTCVNMDLLKTRQTGIRLKSGEMM